MAATLFMGSTISENQPYGYTSLTYGLNSNYCIRFNSTSSGSHPSLPSIQESELHSCFQFMVDISTGISDAGFFSGEYSVQQLHMQSYIEFDWKIAYKDIRRNTYGNEATDISNSVIRYLRPESIHEKISFH